VWFRILSFFDRHQQHVHPRLRRIEKLVIEVYVGDVEGNVLARFRLDAVVKLLIGHHRKRYALDDDRMPGNRGSHRAGLDLLAVENRANGAGDERRVHDGAIDDRVLCQRLQAEAHQLVALLGALQLHGLDGTGADVEPHYWFLFSRAKHRKPFREP